MCEEKKTPPEKKKIPDGFEAYENGKHRRYGLLFAVNGGAFAVARLLADKKADLVLGNLSLRQLCFGMILFTLVMGVDIYAFGYKMRKHHVDGVFDKIGKTVLVVLCLLICAGWFLAT